jgi:site-specific DNA-methyltransferase (adenine-specific)
MIDLRLGRWQDVLGDVECDALITDPPYSERTHKGHNALQGKEGHRRTLSYDSLDDAGVREMVAGLEPSVRGWFVVFSCHLLVPAWARALESTGRYVFAPLPWLAWGSRVRLAGDGPSCWTTWITVSRPRSPEFARWGTLPGGYRQSAANHGTFAAGAQKRHIGGKPDALMRAIVRDYSRPGDLVCDPCAGGGTTLRAALAEGRRAVGAEMDPETWRKARGVPLDVDQRGQQDMFA